jgi:hypothetical protein
MLFYSLRNFATDLGQNKAIEGLFHSFALTLYWKVLQEKLLFIIFSGSAAQRGLWPPRYTRFRDLHNDAPQSVGLLWTGNHSVETQQTNIHAPGEIRTHDRNRRAATGTG